jgi:hypothetical protein
MLTISACKKDNPALSIDQSKNQITVSTNGSAEIEYKQSTYNPVTELNGLYRVGFSRTYYTTATRLLDQYNIIELGLNDKNIFSQTLPYTVKKSQMYVLTIVPNNLGTFYFDSTVNLSKGHLNITVTYAKDQRLIGNYTGVIYSSYNKPPQPDSISVKGSFDVMLPVYTDF